MSVSHTKHHMNSEEQKYKARVKCTTALMLLSIDLKQNPLLHNAPLMLLVTDDGINLQYCPSNGFDDIRESHLKDSVVILGHEALGDSPQNTSETANRNVTSCRESAILENPVQ